MRGFAASNICCVENEYLNVLSVTRQAEYHPVGMRALIHPPFHSPLHSPTLALPLGEAFIGVVLPCTHAWQH